MKKLLPEVCAFSHPSTGMPVLITRGEAGYRELPATVDVDAVNEEAGITKDLVSAMVAGSMFGWDKPIADPDNYDEEGKLKSLGALPGGLN